MPDFEEMSWASRDNLHSIVCLGQYSCPSKEVSMVTFSRFRSFSSARVFDIAEGVGHHPGGWLAMYRREGRSFTLSMQFGIVY